MCHRWGNTWSPEYAPENIHMKIYMTEYTPQNMHLWIYMMEYTPHNIHRRIYTWEYTPQNIFVKNVNMSPFRCSHGVHTLWHIIIVICLVFNGSDVVFYSWCLLVGGFIKLDCTFYSLEADSQTKSPTPSSMTPMWRPTYCFRLTCLAYSCPQNYRVILRIYSTRWAPVTPLSRDTSVCVHCCFSG